MKVAIVGGGFTGLTAAYELTKTGHKVTLFEKEKTLGGLAWRFRQPNWDWYLEGAYHHLFTNDNTIISLTKELHVQIIVKRSITASYWHGKIYQLDSPYHLLTFPPLSMIDKLRTGLLLAGLKINPFWQPLENISAYKLFRLLGGKKSWSVLWEPLMAGKFGTLAETVAASWFWARIKKRTPNLCYIEGGFHTLVTALEKAVKIQGGVIKTNANLTQLPKGFDRILLTVPSLIVKKLLPEFDFAPIPHLHAQTLILETKEPILKDVYWLNITDRSFPFLATVAHTNFMNPKYYGGHHLTYFGNYLPQNHPYLSMTKEELLKIFMPYIQKIANSKLEIVNSFMFIGPFAQPVHQLHYSRLAPRFETGIPNVYVANLDSIYPWDRGTNYSVLLGQQAAKTLLSQT